MLTSLAFVLPLFHVCQSLHFWMASRKAWVHLAEYLKFDCGIYHESASQMFMGEGFAILDRTSAAGTTTSWPTLCYTITWCHTNDFFYATWKEMELHYAGCHQPGHHVRHCPDNPQMIYFSWLSILFLVVKHPLFKGVTWLFMGDFLFLFVDDKIFAVGHLLFKGRHPLFTVAWPLLAYGCSLFSGYACIFITIIRVFKHAILLFTYSAF